MINMKSDFATSDSVCDSQLNRKIINSHGEAVISFAKDITWFIVGYFEGRKQTF